MRFHVSGPDAALPGLYDGVSPVLDKLENLSVAITTG